MAVSGWLRSNIASICSLAHGSLSADPSWVGFFLPFKLIFALTECGAAALLCRLYYYRS